MRVTFFLLHFCFDNVLFSQFGTIVRNDYIDIPVIFDL